MIEIEQVAAKLWARVDQGDVNQCWPWRGSLNGKIPCPIVNYKRKRLSALRLMWEWHTGEEITDRTALMRMCGNRLCVNPHHLAKATHGSLAAQLRHEGRTWAQRGEAAYPSHDIFSLADLAGCRLVHLGGKRYRVMRGRA